MSPGLDRHGISPARHRSGSNNLLSMQRQPSSSGQLHRHPSGSHLSGMQRHPSAAGMQRNSSVSALLRQGSPAMLRRGEQSPAPHRGGASPAVQRPGTASSGGGMSQRQPSVSNGAVLKHGGLAALLRQASSPAIQRPEGPATVMHRQGGRDSVPRQSRSPDVQRAESSAAASQRQGSRAIKGTSPALQRPGALPSPVVAADFARKGSNGLSAYPSGDLAGRSERVCYLLAMLATLCSAANCQKSKLDAVAVIVQPRSWRESQL